MVVDFLFLLVMQLTEELSKVEGKLKLTESLLETKVLYGAYIDYFENFILYDFHILLLTYSSKCVESRNKENQ